MYIHAAVLHALRERGPERWLSSESENYVLKCGFHLSEFFSRLHTANSVEELVNFAIESDVFIAFSRRVRVSEWVFLLETISLGVHSALSEDESSDTLS